MKRQAQQVDRRGAVRSEVALAARICLPGSLFLPCTVRNISSMGAALELVYEAFVPLQFRLQIPDDLFEAECALKHRHGTIVGVEFISARAEALARYG
jgi:hypothetical protein